MENEKQVDVAYLVMVHTDGTFSVKLDDFGDSVSPARQATSADVRLVSQQIIDELDAQVLVNRIVESLVNVLAPPVQEVPDAIKEKLKERGIDPESTAVAE
jgi:hypothetical protein